MRKREVTRNEIRSGELGYLFVYKGKNNEYPKNNYTARILEITKHELVHMEISLLDWIPGSSFGPSRPYHVCVPLREFTETEHLYLL